MAGEHDYIALGPRTIHKDQMLEVLEFLSGHTAILVWSESQQKAQPGFKPSPGYYVRWKLMDKSVQGQERPTIHEADTVPCAGEGTARAQAIRDIKQYIESLGNV